MVVILAEQVTAPSIPSRAPGDRSRSPLEWSEPEGLGNGDHPRPCCCSTTGQEQRNAPDSHEHCPSLSLALYSNRSATIEDEKWHGRGRGVDPDQVHPKSLNTLDESIPRGDRLFCHGLSRDLLWGVEALPIYRKHQRLSPIPWVRIDGSEGFQISPRISEVTYTFVQLFATGSHPTMVRLASNP